MTERAQPPHTLRSRIGTGLLYVLFASPLSPILGVLAGNLFVDLGDDGGSGVGYLILAFAVPGLAALLAAKLARLRIGLATLPATALASVFGWGLLVLATAHFE